MKNWQEGYYYLHVNGQILWKPSILVDSDPNYFDSPYVVKYWYIDSQMSYNRMKVEAKELS